MRVCVCDGSSMCVVRAERFLRMFQIACQMCEGADLLATGWVAGGFFCKGWRASRKSGKQGAMWQHPSQTHKPSGSIRCQTHRTASIRIACWIETDPT